MTRSEAEFSGTGDPHRSMELLWRNTPAASTLASTTRPRRGPKPKLTVDQITAAAIQVADAEGLAALSMRRLADELPVAPMSLYTYVPTKAELVDLMVDTVLGEATPPENEGGGWRERLTTVAHQNWALYHRHPWLLQVSTHRPVLGPNLIAKYDAELRAVDGIGLSDVEMDQVISLVTGYVQGAARASVEAAEIQSRSGITDDAWWEAYAPLLEKAYDAQRYPVAARVGAAAGEAYQAPSIPEHNFRFGLHRILDGIEALVHTRAGDPAR
ncbi:MAG: TetR/AcrR family transcriptional regulator [Micromonosporaceae bacterium]